MFPSLRTIELTSSRKIHIILKRDLRYAGYFLRFLDFVVNLIDVLVATIEPYFTLVRLILRVMPLRFSFNSAATAHGAIGIVCFLGAQSQDGRSVGPPHPTEETARRAELVGGAHAFEGVVVRRTFAVTVRLFVSPWSRHSACGTSDQGRRGASSGDPQTAQLHEIKTRGLMKMCRINRILSLLLISGTMQSLSFTLSKTKGFCKSVRLPEAPTRLYSNSKEDSLAEPSDDQEEEVLFESTVKIDDHGSDLTDRFKYKVNALMGVFDPPTGSVDDERADGNILNAMLKFPISYSFNVVGRTNNDATETDTFVEAVKDIVRENSGSEELTCSITPRGTNYTKVTVEAQVESTSIITRIYKELEGLEQAVMRF